MKIVFSIVFGIIALGILINLIQKINGNIETGAFVLICFIIASRMSALFDNNDGDIMDFFK